MDDVIEAVEKNACNTQRIMDAVNNLPSAQPEHCGDVVSRNAIVQKLNKMDRYVSTELRLCDTDNKFPQNEVFIVDDVYEEIVEQLPSVQPEPHWIPCSERLPDKMGDYLVTLWDDRGTWVEIVLWNETFGGRWQAVLYNDVDYSDISNVIAWLPLPEPYQGER